MKSLTFTSRSLHVMLVKVLSLVSMLLLTFGCSGIKSGFSSLASLIDGNQSSKKVSLDITSLTISEGSSALINVILEELSQTDTTVSISFLDPQGRFASVPTSIVIPAQRLSKSLTLQSNDDSVYQGTQVFILSVSDASSSSAATSELRITVNDNDSAPSVNFSSASQTVAESIGTVNIAVNLSGTSPADVVIPFALSGTATGSGTDYSVSPASSVTIPAGQTTVNVVVTVVNDSSAESDETVIITLGSPTNAISGATTVHTLTIGDDDLGVFNISGITGAGSPVDSTADSLLVGTVNPVVSWAASTGATSYDVTVYATDGTTVVCATQNTATTSYSFSSCNLTRGTSYKASVFSKVGGASRASANNLYSFSVNRLPVANNDGAVRIMKNSSAITLQVITASDSTSRGTVADSDPDAGDTLSVSAITQGANGGTVANNTTHVTYTPPSSTFTGVDSFTYTLSDNHGETATGTVTIHIFDTYTWTGKASTAWAANGNWCGTITNNSCNGSTGYPNSSTTATHVAIFDGTCVGTGHTCTATTAAATQAYGISLASSFTGSLTISSSPGATLTVGVGGYTQAAGTFDGGSNNITIGVNSIVSSNVLNVTGGSFTSTSGVLTLISTAATNNTFVTIGSSVTFNHNSGTFKFAPRGGWGGSYAFTVDLPDLFTFYNVIVHQGDSGAGNNSIQPVSGRTIIVNNDLTHGTNEYSSVYAASMMGGLWQLKGNLIVGANSFGGTGSITMNGTGAQTYAYTAGGRTVDITISKSSGAVTAAGGTTDFLLGKFNLQSGSFTAPSGVLDTKTYSSGVTTTLFTITGGTTFTHNNGTVRFSPIAGWGTTTTFTVDVPDLFSFYNVTVHQGTSGAGSNIVQPVVGRTIIASNNLVHGISEYASVYAASMVGGSWQVQGNLSVGADAYGGLGTITLNSTGAQTYAYATGGRTANLTIDKASGAVTPLGGTTAMYLGKFNLQTGSFTAPSGVLSATSFTGTTTTLFTIASGTTFTHNNGTVKFEPIANWGTTTAFVIDVPDLFSFYNVVVHQGTTGAGYNVLQPVTARTIVVENNFTHGTGQYSVGYAESMMAGLWHIKGNYATGTDAAGGTAQITFNGTGNQQWSNAGSLNGGPVTINKVSGSVVLTSNVIMGQAGQDFFITAGTLDMAGYNFQVMRNITNSGVLQRGTNPSCGTLQYFGSYTGNADVCP